MKNNHFINAYRTKHQRRVRYCFLRHLGLNTNATRSIVGRSDVNIVKSLEYFKANGVFT
jgi:hypothetical protein